MVETVKNTDGLIIGYVEWNLLNERGQFSENSEYIYVADIWVHEEYRKYTVFQHLIKAIDTHPFAQDAKFVYWDFVRDCHGKKIFDQTREDFKDLKQSKIYGRRYFADKILKREGKCSI